MSHPDNPASVAILILNWENWPVTRDCLESITRLEQWGGPGLSLLIADNGSTDDSPDQIRAWVDEQNNTGIRFISNGQNLGVAAGNNAGLRLVMGQDIPPDFVWFLNNDTVVQSDTLTALLRSSSKYPQVQIWGSTLLWEDGETVQYGGGGFYNPFLSVQKDLMAKKPRSKVQNLDDVIGLDFVCGASMLAKAEMIGEKGLLNDQFFLYYEELDLCRRVDSGSEVGWSPKSIVIHAEGSSTMGSREGLKKRQFHENFSTFKFTALHYRPFLFPVMLIRLIVKPLLFVARGQIYLFEPFFRAYSSIFKWMASGRKSNPAESPY